MNTQKTRPYRIEYNMLPGDNSDVMIQYIRMENTPCFHVWYAGERKNPEPLFSLVLAHKLATETMYTTGANGIVIQEEESL